MPDDDPSSSRSEAPFTGNFLLVIDGVDIGFFREVRGLELTVEVEPYQEGGQNGFVYKFPGRTTWPPLVFRRGITNSDALFQWVQKSSGDGFSRGSNKLARSTGAVTALGNDGKHLRSWNIVDAFPVRWTGPQFKADSNELAEEELEVVHHGFTSQTPA